MSTLGSDDIVHGVDVASALRSRAVCKAGFGYTERCV